MIPAVDAAPPWLAPLRPWIERLPARGAVADALNAVAGPESPRFVPQADLPHGEAYEAFIARSGTVPTRDNLHDLFNGLVWQRHPVLKRCMNQLQAAEIAARGIGPARGAARDALTLFDEFGALWPDPPAALVDALRRRDWAALCLTQREAWREARFELVGHALLEQLAVAPRKGLTAHVALGDPATWTAGDWAAKPFLPCPVSAVPGWWPGNDDPAFLADSKVFRPRRP